jgi:4-azaleucine resistance transporter AzlC
MKDVYNESMISKRSEFLTGIKDILPILMGVIPFGLIYGVSARSAGIAAFTAQAMSFIVFAGSAQFVTVQLLGAAVPGGIILLTGVIINLRHALYSASLAPYLKSLHLRWKLLLAYLLTDEAYAVIIIQYQQQGDTTRKHSYFLGAGLALWSTWQMSTAIGIVLGTQVPASWSLDFTLPLTFIALVVPSLKSRAGLVAAVAAGAVAILAANLPFRFGLIIATFVGITIGMCFELQDSKPVRTPAIEGRDGNQAFSQAELPEISPTKQTGKEGM